MVNGHILCSNAKEIVINILPLEWRIIVVDSKFKAARCDCGFCQHWHYEPCDK